MKVIIDIPQDHKRVIDNLVSDGKDYLLPQEVETRLARAVKIGTVIPDNATNGDMIKAMLQIKNEDIKAKNSCVNNKVIEYVIDTDNYLLRFDNNFWNAPYKGVEK